jgi:hypothetical protein
MKNLLIAGIVLATCFIGTASDTTFFATSDAIVTLADATTTLEATDLLYHTTEAVYIVSPVECQHEKLKALDDNCWGYISKHHLCPTEYRQRAYQCKECKEKIVILQAILIEENK